LYLKYTSLFRKINKIPLIKFFKFKKRTARQKKPSARLFVNLIVHFGKLKKNLKSFRAKQISRRVFLRGRREKREKRGGYKAEGKTEKRERGIVLKAKYLLKNKRNFCSDKINLKSQTGGSDRY